MNNKVALITGITGQDGAYLTNFLLDKGYTVHGLRRRSSSSNMERLEKFLNIEKYKNNLFFHNGDMTDSSSITRIIQEVQADEIYNLAAMSHVHTSFEMPEYTADVNALGTLRLLDVVKNLKIIDKVKIYQASTSELYGLVQQIPQDERTPFYPRSPYAIAKLFAYWTTINYREAYGLFACNGILFNHESPIRGKKFVTRKITRGLARILLGLQDKIYLGNLSSKRDWGHAKDYVEAMYLMLQQDKADDFVISTGFTTEVREFIRLAFAEVGITIEFRGHGVDESGIIEAIDYDMMNSKFGIENKSLKIGDELIKVEAKNFRPTEVGFLVGDSSKAQEKLGWKPKYTLENIVKEMVFSDIENMKKA